MKQVIKPMVTVSELSRSEGEIWGINRNLC